MERRRRGRWTLPILAVVVLLFLLETTTNTTTMALLAFSTTNTRTRNGGRRRTLSPLQARDTPIDNEEDEPPPLVVTFVTGNAMKVGNERGVYPSSTPPAAAWTDFGGNETRSTHITRFATGQAREFQAIVNQYCFADDDTNGNDNDASSSTRSSSSSSSCRLLSVDLRILTVDLPELQQVDTLAIAKNKAVLAAQLANGPCLVEDTSLCFHALGGMPGPYIKWFQDTLQSEGTKSCLLGNRTRFLVAPLSLSLLPLSQTGSYKPLSQIYIQ
jgi:hypothetical protein